MTQKIGSSVAKSADERGDEIAALRERVADLERVVAAVGGEVGVARAWLSCPRCEDGVVLVGDRRTACTDCGYVQLL